MFIREMSIDEFKNFANTHFIGNFHESVNYALLKAEEGDRKSTRLNSSHM